MSRQQDSCGFTVDLAKKRVQGAAEGRWGVIAFFAAVALLASVFMYMTMRGDAQKPAKSQPAQSLSAAQ